MNNLITIIMPTFNSQDYIKTAIDSIIDQTYANWELIIVDDYSKDNTVNIIEKYIENDKRIQLIENNMNYGTYYSLNEALKIAKGDYITKLDSDDSYHKDKIKEQIEYCIKNNIEGCTCNILKYYKINNRVCSEPLTQDSSLMFSRKIFNKLGYFDNARFGCDSEFIYRVNKHFKILNLDKPLYYARFRQDSLTSTNHTGTHISSLGSSIRRDYKLKYNKIPFEYVIHPKYIRDYEINNIQRCPIECNIRGEYDVISQDNSLKLNCITKCNFEVIYKTQLGIENYIDNINNYSIKLEYLYAGTPIKTENIKNIISFIPLEIYIKIIINFDSGIQDYFPLILSY